ncbi:MAG: hypothetical protein NC543_01500 [bacterium]|nr:hypothetical protein [bacterium]MCM1375137.1 hypothetical protein [Muribaculum sp.]
MRERDLDLLRIRLQEIKEMGCCGEQSPVTRFWGLGVEKPESRNGIAIDTFP